METLKLSIILALVALTLSAPRVDISPTLQSLIQTKGTADIMITMKSSTTQVLNKVRSQSFPTSNIKATTLYKELNKFTSESQREVLSLISTFKTSSVKGFFITNKISVKGATWELIQALSERVDIDEIREAKVLPRQASPSTKIITRHQEGEVGWGVENVNAPQAWEKGFTGEGVVIGSIDSGVRSTHEALAENFRADHGWLDPMTLSEVPEDYSGYGTHLMAIAVGKNGTGVAPDAQWIACAGCVIGCDEENLFTCGEFMMCPTDTNFTNADCNKRPNIVSNSWGGMGHEDPFYNDVLNAWDTVGIIPFFSSGSTGPNCSTVSSPGDQPTVLQIGATGIDNLVPSASSRGPTLITRRLKPELVAPGVGIKSAFGTGDQDYVTASGTSLASANVAGAAAILLQKDPQLYRQALLTALGESAFRPEVENIDCAGDTDPTNPWPNNLYGYGKIDVSAALDAI